MLHEIHKSLQPRADYNVNISVHDVDGVCAVVGMDIIITSNKNCTIGPYLWIRIYYNNKILSTVPRCYSQRPRVGRVFYDSRSRPIEFP